MAEPRRGKPDVYVASITGYLAGEEFCLYRPWFLARHWMPRDGDFDRATWIADHATLLRAREQQLKERCDPVRVEDQNKFVVRGETATVTGKPDIIAWDKDGPGIVVSDEKTGKRKLADRMQVLTYMWALPKVRPDMADRVLRGEVVYKDAIVEVGSQELTGDVKRQISGLVRQIGFPMPPEKTPSKRECEFCKLSAEDCPEKSKTVGITAEGVTNEF